MEQHKGLKGISASLDSETIDPGQFNEIIARFLEALLFYEEEVLGKVMDSLEMTKKEEGADPSSAFKAVSEALAVDSLNALEAALDVLEALRKAVSENPITTSSDQDIKLEEFLLCINGLVKEFQDLYKAFIEALKRLLPHIDESTKIDVTSHHPEMISLKDVVLSLLGMKEYSIDYNTPLKDFSENMCQLGANALENSFKPIFDSTSSILEKSKEAIESKNISEEQRKGLVDACNALAECLRRLLEAREESINSLGSGEAFETLFGELKERLEEMVTEAENLQTRIKSLQPIDDGTPKDATPEVPKKDPSKAEGEDKEPLEEAPSPVRRAVASLDTGRPFGNLCVVFVLVLAVQGLLRVSGMEHSTLGVSWNTALYSLAVAGAVTYQLWVLAEGCRRGGAGSMARQGWSAVACMAPMLVAVPHAGVIRSSMYSVAVAGLAAVTLYVQDAARRGMPWREACAVGAGNAVLAAACAAGSVAPADGVCGRPFWVWMGVVVFVGLLLAVSYAERGGKRAEGGGVWGCGCECAACDDGCGWDDWVACVWACLP
ncbi:DUF1686 domain-containing protein [Encephalitozoon cuniculi]|nr:DUF1686 domain-containing protein [Encephalitozoon cuniculi]